MNILTFDLEEWFIEKAYRGDRRAMYRQFYIALDNVLEMLDCQKIKASFFCVGQLAVFFPEVIRRIVSKGHEIGCHSNIHTWLDKMDEVTLRRDTIDAIKALEDVSGNKVNSYRAPAFSITPNNKWAINVLAECGIESDASIFPTSRDFGGYKGFPQDTPCIIEYEGASLKEFPICLTSFLGKSMAFSGGGYFRFLPYRFISKTIKKRDYNICYFHLADLITEKRNIMSRKEYEEYFKESGSLKKRAIRYVKSNLGKGESYAKLRKMLADYSFVNIQSAESLIDWNAVNKIHL